MTDKRNITKENLRIVFFGTPEFAVTSLDALVMSGYNVVAVVTMPDKIAGRGHKLIESDVKKYAVEHNIPVLQPEKLKNPSFVETLEKLNADLFIIIAFRMLPEVVWSMPPLGTFNLHASLLPKYRGAAPINRAIMNGETETGITTFFLKHEIDTGDMINQVSTPIGPEESAGEIHDRLMYLGAECVLDTVKKIISNELTLSSQPEGDYTPAPKIFTEDCRINWNDSAINIHNHIRGLSPYPAAWSLLTDNEGKEINVKVFESKVADEDMSNYNPGDVLIKNKSLYVSTGAGVIEIESIQPAGKKRMDSRAFLAGYHPKKFK